MDKRTHITKTSGLTTPRKSGDTGYVSEIFCSIQGEGLYVGERQVFFRTAGCTVTCYWCDTPASKEEQTLCLVHGQQKQSLSNPITVEEATDKVIGLIRDVKPVRTVSLTGGEPLEQTDFIIGVAKALKKRRLKVYLETNGLEVNGLKRIRPHVDIVSMDIKLPYATGHEHWDIHRMFLKWSVGKPVFVKIVIDSITPLAEIKRAVRLISEVDRKVPLVVQPESTTFLKNAKGPEARRKLGELLDQAQRFGLGYLDDVRVIPQCHKVLKVR